MRLHVHRSAEAFLQALQGTTGACYATFARSATDPAVLRQAESIAAARGHRDLVDMHALKGPAEALLRQFFEDAARADPQWRYAHSSRVLLSIPDYPDVSLIFLLRSLEAQGDDTPVHALVQDDWQARLAQFHAEGGTDAAFHPGARRAAARLGRSFARRLLAPAARGQRDVVLFTLGDAVPNGAADSYFGDLAAALARRCTVATVYAAAGRRLRFPVRENAFPLETFLGWTDPLRAWSGSRANGMSAPKNRDAALIAYLRAREHDSGEVAMQRLMAQAFDRMCARLKPKTLVYPFENRSWEKHLLAAARRNGVARCVGYQHSSLTPRHLAFSGAAGLSGMSHLPDAIVTCGEVTAQRIREEVPQARALVQVGAALRAKRLNVGPPVKSGLLAPISSSRSEAWELLRALHPLAERTEVPIVVRTHPTIPIDDLYGQFSWPAHVQLSRGRTLAQDFADTALVVYSSSTVALEGMLYGRFPVWLDIGDVPSGDPIAGEHAFVFRAAGSDELLAVIERIRDLPQDTLERLRREARAYAERYLVEPTVESVGRMVEMIAPC